jgi:CBS-domain-containing membrane protein
VNERSSLQPGPRQLRRLRQRLPLKDELLLVLLPTLTILLVLAFVDTLSRQRVLFASLASSAFLIYLDPQHGMNAVRTLVVSHTLAALAGFGTYLLFGPQYLSAGAAMLISIAFMVGLDAVHPPAVSTSLAFAYRSGDERNLTLFLVSLLVVALLVLLERGTLALLGLFQRRGRENRAGG